MGFDQNQDRAVILERIAGVSNDSLIKISNN